MPLILGNDYVGIVEDIGADVKSVEIGQLVFGRISKKQIETFCEYLVDEENNLAVVSSALTLQEIVRLPLVGLNAYQALFEKMKAKSGQPILIYAGTGGVGSLLIQLAKMQSLTVITTAS